MSSTSIMEHRLKHKLLSMQNGVARISNTKCLLKERADRVRNEIRCTFGHQLACMRSREQELLATLDSIVSFKDGVLSEQQEELHQTIGGCQQALQYVLNQAADVLQTRSIQDMFARLNTVDLRPRENSHIAFEADTLAVRRFITSFGRICSDEHVKIDESLPIDVEEYEMDGGNHDLQHKPFVVTSMPRNITTATTTNWPCARPQLATDDGTRLFKEALAGRSHHHVGNWLGHIKSSVESEPTIFEDFEILRCRSNSNTTVSDQSVEVVNQQECANNNNNNFSDLFSHHFDQILKSSNNQWLLPQSNNTNVDVSDRSNSFTDNDVLDTKTIYSIENLSLIDDEPANCKRKKRNDQHKTDKPDQYDFGTVIVGIRNSENDQWLAKSSPVDESTQTKLDNTIISDSTTTDTTFNESTMIESKQPLRKRHFWYPTVGNQATNVNDQWLAKYATGGGGSDRPVNDSAKDVATWESVLGWQAILEKIHASGDDDWLVPASRNLNIKNDVSE